MPATSSKGLMYVEARINGTPAKVMVDTGATHNFITEEEAKRVGLRWTRRDGWLKAANAKAQPLNGVARDAELHLGTWKGQVDFSVAPMDDFKVVLGMDFFRKVMAISMPCFNSVCILEKGTPCMVPAINGTTKEGSTQPRQLSAMQVANGVRRGEPTFLAALKEESPPVNKEEDVPPIIQTILEANQYVMPPNLPSKLPPRREVDHAIELEPGAKPPAKTPYHKSPPELEELRKQLNELVETGKTRPSKASVVADALSRKPELATISSTRGNLADMIREGLEHDPMAKELIRLVNEGKTRQFWVEDGLLYTKGQRLFVPKWGSLRKELIKECHDTKWAGHPGQMRTMALLETAYFWPHMRDGVDACVKTCLVCQQDKVENKQPAGLLEPHQMDYPTTLKGQIVVSYISGMQQYATTICGGSEFFHVFTCWINAKSSEAFSTFGFDIHHRYSDTVKQFLNLDGLPEEGTVDYYTAMAHRDHLFKGRRLADSTTPPLTFYSSSGNQTYKLRSLNNLYYSVVRVGTPSVEYLVALDTGSDLFWLPCDCTSCTRSFNISEGSTTELNIYSPGNSTTSKPLPCNSPLCGPTRGCSTSPNACSYQIKYGNTTSTGYLVDDVLYLGTDVVSAASVNVPITFGCGKILTGSFLNRYGINGVFGLGMDSISVPSILASKNVTANSFSMCFGDDGYGRIEFGDKGSPGQQTTPFTLQQTDSTYDVVVTEIAVSTNVTNHEFIASLDSSLPYAYFSDPDFSFIVNNDVPCVQKRSAEISIHMQDGGFGYCLAIVQIEDFNIIGNIFMTGYRLVFDREEMVLGWRKSNCYDALLSKTIPPNTTRSPPPQKLVPPPPPQKLIPPPSPPPPPPPRASDVGRLSSMANGLVMVMLAVFAHNFILL
ncbi:PREDICTED: uncharacterized protein LOC105958449 [Erythranthe guttata]|uniref:uncharacterized protein LOC105958449 n=1 Tax=Erythranthe guttata TaxID=4155 RepID=UPI00064E098D|nr:PREDICTED: uncharacterized protein LOC105958449 [Erythranthe guttata]|eukprot:XP_012837907.1 PREDICTED: uncharacterized protein LOC105958449 [Erythranthe guttata]